MNKANQYLKAFDIFVLPSVKEGMPWVILEAMAAGLPIVATRVGGVSEMIKDEQNGLLIEPKNSQVLAEKITRLLKNPEVSQKLGLATKEKIKEFSLEKMLAKTESLYL